MPPNATEAPAGGLGSRVLAPRVVPGGTRAAAARRTAGRTAWVVLDEGQHAALRSAGTDGCVCAEQLVSTLPLVALVFKPGGLGGLRTAVDLWGDTLLCHLAREEGELVAPLARLGSHGRWDLRVALGLRSGRASPPRPVDRVGSGREVRRPGVGPLALVDDVPGVAALAVGLAHPTWEVEVDRRVPVWGLERRLAP